MGLLVILDPPWTRDRGVKLRLFFSGGGRTAFHSYERRSCKYSVSCVPSAIVVVLVRLLAPLRPRLTFFFGSLLGYSLGPCLGLGDNLLQASPNRPRKVLLHLL